MVEAEKLGVLPRMLRGAGRMEPMRVGVAVSSSPMRVSSSWIRFWVTVSEDCSVCRRSRSFWGDCIRSFLVCDGSSRGVTTPLMVLDLGFFSGCGEGFLTMLPTPGRSDKPDREGVERFGEPAFEDSVGMFEVGRTGLLFTSSLP